MELEETQFIKNKENDVMNRRTKGEWLIVQIVKVSFVVGVCYILYRLLTDPTKSSYWIDFFVIIVFGSPFVTMFFGGETAKRKKCIKKGRKFAAKLINVDEWDCQDGGRKYTDYISRFRCLENDKEYVVHFDNLDPREYIENPYCNIYVLEREWQKSIVAVKDFCIKPEHLSKSGYFLVK